MLVAGSGAVPVPGVTPGGALVLVGRTMADVTVGNRVAAVAAPPGVFVAPPLVGVAVGAPACVGVAVLTG